MDFWNRMISDGMDMRDNFPSNIMIGHTASNPSTRAYVIDVSVTEKREPTRLNQINTARNIRGLMHLPSWKAYDPDGVLGNQLTQKLQDITLSAVQDALKNEPKGQQAFSMIEKHYDRKNNMFDIHRIYTDLQGPEFSHTESIALLNQAFSNLGMRVFSQNGFTYRR